VIRFLAALYASTVLQASALYMEGHVTDSCGDPITKAQITLTVLRNGRRAATTRTGQHGYFVFPQLVPVVYQMRVEAPNAKPFVRKVDALEGKDIEIPVAMTTPNLVLCPAPPPVPYHAEQ
jgi:hypothetical protein